MRARPLVFALVLLSSGCFRGGGFMFLAGAAVATAVIVSHREPPPPHVDFVPEPRPGYTWQPGYWTPEEERWRWVDGGWVAMQPGYAWSPTRWERTWDGDWELVPGRWVPSGFGPPPPEPE